MRFQKKVSLGNFLKKGEDFKDGDILQIANEGKQVEGQYGTQDIFLVKKGDQEGNVAFNRTTINNLIDAYGEESTNWIGKDIKVFTIKQNVQGKITTVYYFLHPESELDEETGTFVVPNKSKEEIPVIDPNEEAQVAAEEENEM